MHKLLHLHDGSRVREMVNINQKGFPINLGKAIVYSWCIAYSNARWYEQETFDLKYGYMLTMKDEMRCR